jgi:thiosulfate dehydrogenase
MGMGNMPELTRAADPVRGRTIYNNVCAACHNTDGSGIARSRVNLGLGYMNPPLWGNDSFNNGAGMARISTMANFVHFNMPHGTDYVDPQLSEEDAWDVSAYVLTHPRPQKANLDKDYPNLLAKPVDTPYGPYADSFSAEQHKVGPFAPIRAAIAKLKAEKGAK